MFDIKTETGQSNEVWLYLVPLFRWMSAGEISGGIWWGLSICVSVLSKQEHTLCHSATCLYLLNYLCLLNALTITFAQLLHTQSLWSLLCSLPRCLEETAFMCSGWVSVCLFLLSERRWVYLDIYLRRLHWRSGLRTETDWKVTWSPAQRT